MSSLKVSVNNISKIFFQQKVVNNVSFSAAAGEIFGIVGPDGAGKSTILRMLAAIMTPDTGLIEICGYSTRDSAETVKENIAYMSQKFGLYPDLTVEENVKFYAGLYSVPQKGLNDRIEELLRFSHMYSFRKRLAGALSGGMKQKLQLICALIHTPEVLILDEPTNGVDPVSRRDFWQMLSQLATRGVTIVVSTSYLDEAEKCQRIALLHQGQFMQTGNLNEIISQSNIKIRQWQGNDATVLFKKLEKANDSIRLFGNSIHIKEDQNFNGIQNQIDELQKKFSFSGKWLENTAANLEDVFVNLMQQRSATPSLQKPHFKSHHNKFSEGLSVNITGLTRKFGDFIAVDSIDLKVKQGEIFGFLGPNGAGKSTTIRMLCGLLLPSSGSGTVAGLKLFSQSEKIKQVIGYMSQKFSLYVDLTIVENIRFYGGIYGLSGKELNERIQWALKLANLESQGDIQVKFLSLGFRQRLALACSLLHDPSIVFLDEPTSGVDPLTRRKFWETIRELAYCGVTVFVTTHYMEEAEYCDRIAFINFGKVMATGSPSGLKTEISPGKTFTSMADVFIELTMIGSENTPTREFKS